MTASKTEFSTAAPNLKTFADLRYGMIVHYGLYSLLGRGEWVLNREQIPVNEYRALANDFTAERFDADALCDLAARAGMRYIVFTTMHHDGFRLYDTQLSDFSTAKSASGRDLVAEVVTAARARGLKIGLYHSLNIWTGSPDAVAALESRPAYEKFIEQTFARLRELNEKYRPFDVMWYDGWWPFNADEWQGERMNQMIRKIQPGILFNGRNGLPGDFATPEGHLAGPRPWRPWEACMPLNNSWGFHAGDDEWKSPRQVVDMLATVAQGNGNLLLNVGLRGDGSVPPETTRILEAVGGWLGQHAEAIYHTDRFTYDLRETVPGDRGDWSHHGPFTASGNHLYLLLRRWPGQSFSIGGLQSRVLSVELMNSRETIAFTQTDNRLTISNLPAIAPTGDLCPALKLTCAAPPSIYLTGGLRTPAAPHCRYDPCPSDIQL